MATTEAAIQAKPSNGGTAPERIDADGTHYRPRVDICETPEAFVFQADLPGVKAEDVEIDCDDGEISIRGKVRPRQPETQQYVDREYGVGNFYRAFTIDAPIKADAIKAELKNGVLTLTVPMADSAKTRKIPVVAP
jgi:HSP20 family protein